ncbi:hypothetical protein [Nocardioides acrostichi]|uniref:Uncharacterized protein n=1 Tax=Nocardioides acrostichi TaxID=2784339 RepID=A0A930UWG4_9ACTN|nr:hypothetical protein [Nocardioides acrostichi]MBF4160932.1 hypothetical protein [Nocardioides acrostichi]
MSDPSPTSPDTPRARHLMDPANITRDNLESPGIKRVQKWVVSVLVVTTILHFAGGLLVAAWFIDPSFAAQRYGLAVLAGAVSVLAVAAGRAIHRVSPFTPWLLLGVLPTAIAIPLLARG